MKNVIRINNLVRKAGSVEGLNELLERDDLTSNDKLYIRKYNGPKDIYLSVRELNDDELVAVAHATEKEMLKRKAFRELTASIDMLKALDVTLDDIQMETAIVYNSEEKADDLSLLSSILPEYQHI